MPLSAVIFDLDGTLVDSGADLAGSANYVRGQRGLPALADDVVLSFVGDGVRKLLQRTLAHGRPGTQPSEEEVDRAHRLFADHYATHLLDRTVPYPGIPELLRDLQPLPLMVATNKPRAFTLPILVGLGLVDDFVRIVAGDDLERRKPHPEHLERCLDGFGIEPADCVMVGDSPNDIMPARELGMTSVAVTWGLVAADRLAAAGPDHLVDDAEGIRRVLLADG